jgi:signal transduction histidine kinase
VSEYAELPITPVTLDYLLNLEQDIDVCAVFSHNELPKRLARRVRAIEGLPFIVGTNPYISKVYALYKDSFNTLVRTPPPNSPDSLQHFTNILSELTDSHQQVIPLLASGFMESGKYMTLETRQKFLDQMISARIGIRLIAEHYLSLHHPNNTGIVSRNANPAKTLKNICEYVQQVCEMNYGTFPDFVINGYVDTSVAYINVHFEYIFMELIKNAMRATVEKSMKLARLDHPKVEITIGKSDDFVVIRLLKN